MSEVMASLHKKGGGGGNLKDIYRELVFNGGFSTTYSLTVNPAGRCTVNEAQISIDTSNHRGYLYADFVCSANMGTDDYYSTLIASMPKAYTPKCKTTDVLDMPLTTDDGSTVSSKSWFLLNSYSTTSAYVCVTKGQGWSASDHYIVYGSWQY